MKPTEIDIDRGELVAFASSDTGRDRWSELAVYHFADRDYVGARPWLSVLRGCSRILGERTREQRLWVGSLERALKLFDQEATLGILVAETARDWAELTAAARQTEVRSAHVAIGSDRDALAHLYGTDASALPPLTVMAGDLGVGESSIRMAMKRGTDVKVGLRAIAGFVPRGALAIVGEGSDDA